MKWPALSTYTTGGLRDWSEQEEEVNGSFGSPHHGNRGAAATMPQKHRTLCLLIACLYRSGIKKYVRTNRTEKASHTMSDGTKKLQGGLRKPAKSK
jgi:hypothetical protein